MSVVGIVLAAGMAKRMGECKLLLSYKGKPILQHVVDNAVNSNLDRVIVVLGSECNMIVDVVNFEHVVTIYNPEFESGISSSMRCGVSYCKEGEDAIFLMGDQPFVTTDIINELLGSYRSSITDAVAPVVDGEYVNPVLLNSLKFDDVIDFKGDDPPFHILNTFNNVQKIESCDAQCFVDINTPQDWKKYCNI